MPLNFPTSPANNDTYTDSATGSVYKYNSAYFSWTNISTSSGGGSGSGISNVIVVSANTTAFSGNLHLLTANVGLTLPASPIIPTIVLISNQSGYANSVVLRNNEKIMGLAEDMIIDTVDAGFTLVYTGTSKGWVIT